MSTSYGLIISHMWVYSRKISHNEKFVVAIYIST
nr:MAG TPA: hypothetical protein [Caudoviricetes sp.]